MVGNLLLNRQAITYSGFLSQEKTFANFAFWRFVKVLSMNIYFQAIKHRTSGRIALGYCKFAIFSLQKSIFQAICESFLPRKKPTIRYFNDDKLSVVWDTPANLEAIHGRVNLLLRGCKFVTGCSTGRCGCKRNSKKMCRRIPMQTLFKFSIV